MKLVEEGMFIPPPPLRGHSTVNGLIVLLVNVDWVFKGTDMNCSFPKNLRIVSLGPNIVLEL